MEAANRSVERWQRGRRRATDKAVWWKDADDFGHPLVRLEFRIGEGSAARRFKPAELPREGYPFSDLMFDVLGRDWEIHIDRMISTVRAWREELESEVATAAGAERL